MEWLWQKREKSGSGYILKGKLTEPAGGWNVKQAIKGKFDVLVKVSGSCQLLSWGRAGGDRVGVKSRGGIRAIFGNRCCFNSEAI